MFRVFRRKLFLSEEYRPHARSPFLVILVDGSECNINFFSVGGQERKYHTKKLQY